MLNLIANRHSKRSFLDEPIPLETVKRVLSIAGNAPSSKNTQPWKVAVVYGESLSKLSHALLEEFDSDQPERPDYQYMLEPTPVELLERAKITGYGILALKGIAKNDMEQRRLHTRENFLFFGAPLELFFLLPKKAERGNFLDLGLYIQNVILGLLSEGISSCLQASIVRYPDTIRKVLSLSEEVWIVTGLACGYADDHKVNTFVPERIDIAEYTSFHG